MKNVLLKIYGGVCLFMGIILASAQAVPPPPPSDQSGDIGGPATPIDLYFYILLLAVPFLIYYYKRKIKSMSS